MPGSCGDGKEEHSDRLQDHLPFERVRLLPIQRVDGVHLTDYPDPDGGEAT